MPGQVRGIYKKWFWNTYDYLGTLILVNILWVLCSLPVITLPMTMSGLFRVTNRIAAYEETGVRDFFSGIRDNIWRSLRLCGAFSGVLLLLIINILFYLRMMTLWSWTGAILSGAMIWLVMFVGLLGIYCFPLLGQRETSTWQIIKTGMFLVLDNARYSIGLLMVGLAILMVSLLSGVGILFGGVAAIGVLCSTGLREIQKQYETSETDEASHKEEARGWRDLFRPWEYQ